ncbi:hypothetical protein GQ600_17786 [Phytophthora cactorum]|nr:hypothetical protein GQ600_17786 [Phytophthora cactorum]
MRDDRCAFTGYCMRWTSGGYQERSGGGCSELGSLFEGQRHRDVELYLPIASTPRCLWCNGYAPWDFTILQKAPKSNTVGNVHARHADADPGLVALGWVDNKPVFFGITNEHRNHHDRQTRKEWIGYDGCLSQTGQRHEQQYTTIHTNGLESSRRWRWASGTRGAYIGSIKDTRANDGVKRLRQRQRRVCALLAREEGRKPPATATWYCEKCSTNSRGLYFMCDGIRNHPSNPGLPARRSFTWFDETKSLHLQRHMFATECYKKRQAKRNR